MHKFIVKGKIMVNLTKQEKDRMGWSSIVGTVAGAVAMLISLQVSLQNETPALEAVGGGLMSFLIVGGVMTGVAYGLLSLLYLYLSASFKEE